MPFNNLKDLLNSCCKSQPVVEIPKVILGDLIENEESHELSLSNLYNSHSFKVQLPHSVDQDPPLLPTETFSLMYTMDKEFEGILEVTIDEEWWVTIELVSPNGSRPPDTFKLSFYLQSKKDSKIGPSTNLKIKMDWSA